MKDTRGSYRISYFVGGSALIVTAILFEVLNLVCFRKQTTDDDESDDEYDDEPTVEIKINLNHTTDKVIVDHTTDEIKLLDEKLHQCESNSENSESNSERDETESNPRRKSVTIIYEEENEHGNSSDKGYNWNWNNSSLYPLYRRWTCYCKANVVQMWRFIRYKQGIDMQDNCLYNCLLGLKRTSHFLGFILYIFSTEGVQRHSFLKQLLKFTL